MTVISLLILGFVLTLDNFRLAIALGAFKLSWRRALRIAVVFGLWDAFSPLVGLLIGSYSERRSVKRRTSWDRSCCLCMAYTSSFGVCRAKHQRNWMSVWHSSVFLYL